MIWNEEIECMPPDEMKKTQLKRLQDTVKRAYENVPYFQKRFDEEGIKPEDIKTLNDIQKLPLTTKDDLRAAYPLECLQFHDGRL
jgi:phenylacetate-CoA ligase